MLIGFLFVLVLLAGISDYCYAQCRPGSGDDDDNSTDDDDDTLDDDDDVFDDDTSDDDTTDDDNTADEDDDDDIADDDDNDDDFADDDDTADDDDDDTTGGCDILVQNFEGAFPPSTWTVTGGWKRDDEYTHYPNGNRSGSNSGFCAAADPDACTSPCAEDGYYAALSTPDIDLTGLASAYLGFWNYFRQEGGSNAYLNVSMDHGQSWTEIREISQDHGPALDTLDLSPFAGQTIRLQWVYETIPFSPGIGWWWHVDSVCISSQPIPVPSLKLVEAKQALDDDDDDAIPNLNIEQVVDSTYCIAGLAVGASSEIHMSFKRMGYNASEDCNYYSLMHVTNQSGTWIEDTVDQGTCAYWGDWTFNGYDEDRIGNPSTIAMNTAGQPNFAYRHQTYAWEDPWYFPTETYYGGYAKFASPLAITTLFGTTSNSLQGGQGEYSGLGISLDIDANDTAAIAAIQWYFPYDYFIKLIWWDSDTGANQWLDTCVFGVFQAVARRDSSGVNHMAYACGKTYDNRILRYATDAAGSWWAIEVDSVPSFQKTRLVAMDLDSQNTPHIAYIDDTDLYYVQMGPQPTTPQRIRQIDIPSQYGFGKMDMFLDGSDAAHLCAYDSVIETLVYGTNKSGSWCFYTVDYSPGERINCAIDLDNSGLVHIGYYKSDYIWHAFFDPAVL